MSQRLTLRMDRLPTALGELVIVADREGRLRAVDWTNYDDRLHRLFARHYGQDGYSIEPEVNPSGLTDAMRDYFAGDVTAIDTLEVATNGTEFQRLVWRELRHIPAGERISYSELARRIGKPAATRAVGLANGANPVGIVVPCHRVVGANGTLTGYGGGIERKKWLLAHEAATAVNDQLALAI